MYRLHGERVDDLWLPLPLSFPIGEGGWLVGEHVAIEDAKAIGEQQPADQGELAGVVVRNDGDTPASVIERFGVYLHQTIAGELLDEGGVALDLLLAKGVGVGFPQALDVAVDIGS